MNIDEMYVINQPKHSIVSLVVFNDNITEEIHKNLAKLNDISDIIFIFSRDQRRINKNKLTSLYNSCGWIESFDNIGFTIFKTLEYCINIFQIHRTFLILSSNNLIVEDKFFENIEAVNSSSLVKPIFKLKQLSSEEYKGIYTRKLVENNSFLNKIRKKLGYEEEFEEDSDDNMFCSYTSESKALVYFRPTIIKLIEFNNNNIYSELFNSIDPRYLFASMTKYLNIDIIDCSIENLAIGKL